jgi:hypothetical protein
MLQPSDLRELTLCSGQSILACNTDVGLAVRECTTDYDKVVSWV